jgi:STE24 endopeptidase
MLEWNTSLTWAFSLLLISVTATQLWLIHRQTRHVAQHRASVPLAFAGTIPLAAHHKAADYTLAKGRLTLIELVMQSVVVLGWTLLGGLNTLNHWLLGWMEPGLLQQLVLLAAFVLTGSLLDLPLAWYRTFRLEEKFGFNRTTLRDWLLDGLKGGLVAALMGLPIAALILTLMGSAGNLWWAWAWACFMGFNLLLMVIYPTLIAPLFNSFQPLADEALKDRVTQLMARCGFQAKGLFVMDGSRRSAHANAYFTGLGASKRVVFYDTLLAQLGPDEVDAVLAHELGHFHHRHIRKRMVIMSLMSLAGFALLGWLSGQAGFYEGLGVEPNLQGPNDALALLLFMLVVPLLSFYLSPLMAARSRRDEFEADRFASEKTDGQALTSALLKLHQDNATTLTPDPWFVWFYYSHPPASERLARLTPT